MMYIKLALKSSGSLPIDVSDLHVHAESAAPLDSHLYCHAAFPVASTGSFSHVHCPRL